MSLIASEFYALLAILGMLYEAVGQMPTMNVEQIKVDKIATVSH